jgi:hypothetical protein
MVVMERLGPDWKDLWEYEGEPWAPSALAAAVEAVKKMHTLTVTRGPLKGGSTTVQGSPSLQEPPDGGW